MISTRNRSSQGIRASFVLLFGILEYTASFVLVEPGLMISSRYPIMMPPNDSSLEQLTVEEYSRFL